MYGLRIFILTSLFLLALDVAGQKFEFGGTSYATSYMGDLNPTNITYYKGHGAGLFTRYKINPTWGLRLALNQLSIAARDQDFKNSYQQQRNLILKNSVSELSFLTEFDFFTLKPNLDKKHFTPYLLAGIGIIKHRPELYVDTPENEIKSSDYLISKNKKTPIDISALAFIIPFGIGLSYQLRSPWKIGLECNYRQVWRKKNNSDRHNNTFNTNKSDDWQFFTVPSIEYSKNIRTLRGEEKKWDGYMTTGITITYVLRSNKCEW